MNSPGVVIIVGGSSGIGRAAALQFARQGATIVLVSRGQPALEAAAISCGAWEQRTCWSCRPT
jgi:NAD(P)-dependent dehydrogenase (short-subunit alcohol dehydrogenase family)